jgi:hypothetical protein
MLGRELLRTPYWALKAEAALGTEPCWPIQYGYAVKRRASGSESHSRSRAAASAIEA